MLPILFLENPSQYCIPIYAKVFEAISFLHVSAPRPYMHLSSPLLLRATCLAHLVVLDLITELYSVQSVPVHTMTVHGRLKA